ncbi:MAG: DUF4176 domain-containing protein [Candidatus Fimenecus sp.]
MNISELLPIGSVVLLKNGKKRLMIIGVKQTDLQTNTEYDYLSVLYPEGFVNPETTFFFNHDAIEHIFFLGMNDNERTEFLEKLTAYYDSEQKE